MLFMYMKNGFKYSTDKPLHNDGSKTEVIDENIYS